MFFRLKEWGLEKAFFWPNSNLFMGRKTLHAFNISSLTKDLLGRDWGNKVLTILACGLIN